MNSSSVTQKFLLLIVLTLSTTFLSAQNKSAELSPAKKLAILESILNSDERDTSRLTGEPITIDQDFYECVFLYKYTLKDYGIEEHPGSTPISITKPPRQVTYYINFRGENLTSWLTSIKAPSGDPKDIDIRITEGIYTSDYLTHHGQSITNESRFTVFLVPYIKGTDTLIGTTAYNLGGLHP